MDPRRAKHGYAGGAEADGDDDERARDKRQDVERWDNRIKITELKHREDGTIVTIADYCLASQQPIAASAIERFTAARSHAVSPR